jgi:hypothetical protein
MLFSILIHHKTSRPLVATSDAISNAEAFCIVVSGSSQVREVRIVLYLPYRRRVNIVWQFRVQCESALGVLFAAWRV